MDKKVFSRQCTLFRKGSFVSRSMEKDGEKPETRQLNSCKEEEGE